MPGPVFAFPIYTQLFPWREKEKSGNILLEILISLDDLILSMVKRYEPNFQLTRVHNTRNASSSSNSLGIKGMINKPWPRSCLEIYTFDEEIYRVEGRVKDRAITGKCYEVRTNVCVWGLLNIENDSECPTSPQLYLPL